jgi:ribosomal protein L16 Arg81 hydroxylase
MSDLIPDDWKSWLFEGKLAGISDDFLVSTMLANGFPEDAARAECRAIEAHPYFRAARKNLQGLNKITSVLDIRADLRRLSGRFGQVDRRNRPSPEEFRDAYYSQNLPVVLTGMMEHWAALSAWSPDYFVSNFGEAEVEVMSGREANENYEIEIHKHRTAVTFGDYVRAVFSKGPTNDYYLVANNDLFSKKAFRPLLGDIEMFPGFLDPSIREGRVFFWMGPAGTVTPLHHDQNNIFLAQVIGRKRVKLVSPEQTHLLYNHVGVFSEVDLKNPDFEKHPLFQKATVLELVLQPGEVLFIPVGWWHFVESLDPAVSVSFTNFVFPNSFLFRNPQGHAVTQDTTYR